MAAPPADVATPDYRVSPSVETAYLTLVVGGGTVRVARPYEQRDGAKILSSDSYPDSSCHIVHARLCSSSLALELPCFLAALQSRL